MFRFFIISCLIFIFQTINFGQQTTNKCYRWLTQIDPKLERFDIDEVNLSEKEVFDGIECLLSFQGNRETGRFSGLTGINYNWSTPPKIKKNATVEINALYYISYIFYKNWNHDGSVLSVRLFDEDSLKTNTKKIVKRSFESYKKWFTEIKKIGLEKAREKKLDPLENSGIYWH